MPFFYFFLASLAARTRTPRIPEFSGGRHTGVGGGEMSAAARKAAGSVTARAPALVLALAAFLISYNFFAVAFRGAGAGAGRDPVVPMPAWMRAATGGAAARRRPFHVALTATDAAYSRWQCRVMYYWYKQMQARPGCEAMGGFTRVLHSGKPDGLVDEIPTFVVDPLPAGKDHVSADKPSHTVSFSLFVDRRGGRVGLQKILSLNDMF
jgi:hypothetical protein